MKPVKKEPIVIDLDSDDEDVLCGELNEVTMDTDVSVESGEANPSNMQMTFSAAGASGDDNWDNKIDHQYLKLFDSLMDDGNSYLSDNPLRCIRYEVDNGGYDEREFKGKQKSRVDGATKKNAVVSRTPHRVQASTKKTREFVLRRRESPVSDKSVDATSHARRNSQRDVEARDKEIREAEMVPDEGYKSYLTSLVEKRKSSSGSKPEKEIQVKREEVDAMSLSDSDSIEVDDRPFLDEEVSPFVASKSYKVVDLEEESEDEGDQCSSWFRKEIMNVLKKPYSEKEFKELEHVASVCKWLTKSKELLDGRDFTYTTNQKTPSYLDQYPEFKRMFERALYGEDRYRALNLLRGFIFYLTKVARHDAFKPWLDNECLKVTCF
ncbi:Uncharacterized protein Rs2_01883 [Raphanus sativus]|nr:Uncharacterized protein Rs2_01883 [Raphanus sativus]